jgi:hypothetical protein
MIDAPSYLTAEGLRLLLVRLHYSGPHAWRDDAEAASLMDHVMRKYAALAHKHELEPADAAVAAFEVMATRSARTAQDPWAVVTRAVQLSLIYEERAQGLLCSSHQARRSNLNGFHDAERFSDRDTELAEYHPAFRVEPDLDEIGAQTTGADPSAMAHSVEPTNAYVALDAAVALFVDLGWPEAAARLALEYICSRLIGTGDRVAAYESLRRDRTARALLDLDQRAWIHLLRAVLGHPSPDLAATSQGRGVLLRLLLGHRVDELFADVSLVAAIENAGRARGADSHV